MSPPPSCPHCHHPLPADAPLGLCPACLLATEPAPPFTAPAPEELAPSFPQLEVLALLGQGGMGAVYKARQKELERFVALKILPPGIGAAPAFAERFAREARALARLGHPNIVTLYDFGQTADGLFYFLMEYVEGANLRQVLRGGKLSAEEALAIVPQICEALQYAHERGIIHRDIKPENILLSHAGVVKLADFGVARLVALPEDVTPGSPEAPAQMTQSGHILGTPRYMAPEQAQRPLEVDHRADLYSLGVVFYQMLTGELPGRPIALPSRKSGTSSALDEVVLRALEADPTRRFADATAFRTSVENARAPRPQRRWRGLAALGALLMLVGVGWLLLRPYVWERRMREFRADTIAQMEERLAANRRAMAPVERPALPPILALLREGKTQEAVKAFRTTNWESVPLFAPDAPLGQPESARTHLSRAEAVAMQVRLLTDLQDLQRLQVAVYKEIAAARARSDRFTEYRLSKALYRWGRSLDLPEHPLLLRSFGQSVEKKARQRLETFREKVGYEPIASREIDSATLDALEAAIPQGGEP